ncbi:hypothetical protein H0H93_009542 [Arthromyces matolae]|nr:hypothetical protein H0H93_009542 [Arthromyces matolae]
MSRQSGSSFHKPTPFQFPAVPLSPPETDLGIMGPSPMAPFYSRNQSQEFRSTATEPSPAHSAPTPGSNASQLRKMSSITYTTSAFKESRERTPQRAYKTFIVVIPPPSLIQEHGQLGNTLASGPPHRLANGLLMPLFPTMYGQLTAIAREFNFPSITGVCLYLHFVENGMTITPRISDETWPFLWAHVFEPSSPTKSPVSGRIEFDIDIDQARWYMGWLASSNRQHIDPYFSMFPDGHERSDSKSVQGDEQGMMSVPGARHAPRKLSLIDRYDMLSARAGSRHASGPGLPPPERPHTSAARVLSPIFQGDEPKTAKESLDNRVKSWRSTTIIKPTSLAGTGQTSLEPANMPNAVPIDDTFLDASDDQLNLEDFHWSVTSAGPEDYDPFSPVSWDRAPSIHIAERMAGSVCLTPSVCTSFGPSDETFSSPALSHYRLPSPDIGYRMLDDAPTTPLTATSWGAPSEYPPTSSSLSRAPSVDLGDRVVFSPPVTPTTATTWGPASWPSSPVYTEYPSRSVHLADRGNISCPLTPFTATSWGAPLSYPPTPRTPFYVSTPDAGHRGFEDSEYDDIGRISIWRRAVTDGDHSRPSSSSSRHAPWGHVWPYILKRLSEEVKPNLGRLVTARSPSAYPHLLIYEPVYPHFDLYPALQGNSERSATSAPGSHPITSSVASDPGSPVKVRITSCYPALDLYPSVYPHNLYEIYPSTLSNELALTSPVAETRSNLDSHVATLQSTGVEVALRSFYPSFNIYPPVYPIFEIYPSIERMNTSRLGYPYINTSTSSTSDKIDVIDSLTVPSSYPSFNLCSSVALLFGSESQFSSHLDPSVYPYFNIYPTIPREDSQRRPGADQHQEHGHATQILQDSTQITNCGYPVFNLYPAIYPYFDLYPVQAGGVIYEETTKFTAVMVVTQPHYPAFRLYPAIYPYFDLYPSIDTPRRIEQTSKSRQKPPHRLTHNELHAIVMMERVRGIIDDESKTTAATGILPGVFPVDFVTPQTGALMATPSQKLVEIGRAAHRISSKNHATPIARTRVIITVFWGDSSSLHELEQVQFVNKSFGLPDFEW